MKRSGTTGKIMLFYLILILLIMISPISPSLIYASKIDVNLSPVKEGTYRNFIHEKEPVTNIDQSIMSEKTGIASSSNVTFSTGLSSEDLSSGQDLEEIKLSNELAIEYISKTYAIPQERLKIVQNEILEDIITADKARAVMMVDSKSYDKENPGKIYSLAVYPSLEVTERRLWDELVASHAQTRYGKLSPELNNYLSSASSSENINVAIWMKCDSEEVIRTTVAKYPQAKLKGDSYTEDTDPVLYKQIRAEIDEALKETYDSSRKAILDDLRIQGIDVSSVSKYAPTFFAEMPKTLISEMEKRPDVDMIYKPSDNYILQSTAYKQTIGIPPVGLINPVNHTLLDGTGITIAVIDQFRIDNPELNDNLIPASGGINDPWQTDPPPPQLKYEHATRVAGVIAANNIEYKGIAPNVNLWSGNFIESYSPQYAMAAMETALSLQNPSVDIILASIGADTGGDYDWFCRYCDHIIYCHDKPVIVSAGNRYLDQYFTYRYWVNSPALGYNVIAVGNYDDKETVPWHGDSMSESSCYLDPPYRKKPEVAAPGTNITTLNRGSGNFIDSGPLSPRRWLQERPPY
jgi:hypothetical protein